MILRPAFKARFHIEAVPGEGIFLLSENQQFVLEGPQLWHVVPLIDGSRTTNQIVEALQSLASPGEVYAAIALLEREGHIQEADPSMPLQFAAFWSEMNLDTRILPAIFARVPVQVVALDGIDPRPMQEVIQSFGVVVAEPGRFMVVLVDDYLTPDLYEINKMCVSGTPWLLLKPTGVNIWLGPLIVPGRTACWRCLEHRLRNNREVDSFIERKKGLAGPFPVARAQLWVTQQQAYCMAAVQLVRWLTTGVNASLESRVLIAETVPLQFTTHLVMKRPQCPDCGNPRLGTAAGRPIAFQGRQTDRGADDGEHLEPADVTFNRLSAHISPITGVVSDVYPTIPPGVSPLHVYRAGHNFALKNDSLYFLKDGLRAHSSGKGKSDIRARTSALCEALERYSGVFRNEEERVTVSRHDLGDQAIHPNECMLYSLKQYREREQWLSKQSRFNIVPVPFDASARIEWTPVYSVSQRRPKYLPTSYLYYGYPTPQHQFFCWADSNGNAAGSSLEDASLQGICELVERDSVSMWWYNQVQRPRVNLESFGEPYVRTLEHFYAGLGNEFWVLDVTSDTGIPSFAAINRRIGGPTEDIIMGFGAHPDARVAVMRAITEMNQFMPAVLTRLPNGTTQYMMNDVDAVTWWQMATVDNQPYLKPLPEEYDRRAADYPETIGGSIQGQLLHCIDIVERLGMEVLILDQTRLDVGLSVVKVIVPGMRHFWARFAPGRLYEVPVRLGWMKAAKDEAELNPVSMFL
jgi:bacteriocin biosynthesis cyclodehydratase domain-containing protein